VNRAVLVERIAELVNEKVITDITAVRDESDENTRVVIELKRDAIAKVVINNLYKHTALESSFSVNSLAIDHGRPKTLNLKELINCYIEHRREVVIRRTRFELRKAEERAETSTAISSPWPTSTNSSASSANPPTAKRPASSSSPSTSPAPRSSVSASLFATKTA
jgi:DNA gyrase/topoisomerase IV subunit A